MVQRIRVGSGADAARTERQPYPRTPQTTTHRSALEQEHKIPLRTLHRNRHSTPSIPRDASIRSARRLIRTGTWLHAPFLDLPRDRACRLDRAILGSWETIDTDPATAPWAHGAAV